MIFSPPTQGLCRSVGLLAGRAPRSHMAMVTTPSSFQRIMRSEPMRRMQIGLGVVLLILGPLIGGPLPGPLGVIGFAVGLALVLRNSLRARRRYVIYKRRYPRIGYWFDVGLRRKRRPRGD